MNKSSYLFWKIPSLAGEIGKQIMTVEEEVLIEILTTAFLK